MKHKVAIIDDEADMRSSIAQWLTLSGFEAETFASAEIALKTLSATYEGVVVSDIKMPGIDGMGLLKRLQSVDPALPVLLITGHGDVALAVEAMQIGAYDFIEKPFDPERLADLVKRAANARRLTLDNRRLRREMTDGTVLLRKLVGSSSVIEKLRETILDMAQSDGHILVTGETGTGKNVIAHALHACGPRSERPVITLNCTALGDSLEKTLFGPSSEPDERPVLEAANGGTICIEDIETMPEKVQARLLSEVFSETDVEAGDAIRDIRFICLSSRIQSVTEAPDTVREDLFFRLSTLHISIPPLRERGEDILLLFNRFCAQFAEDYGCDAPEISADDAARMMQFRWPGNIRQLINVAERAVLQSRRGESGLGDLIDHEATPIETTIIAEAKPLKEHVEAFEKMLIDNALRRNRGAVTGVMEELALPRRTLNEKMAKYGLVRAEYL